MKKFLKYLIFCLIISVFTCSCLIGCNFDNESQSYSIKVTKLTNGSITSDKTKAKKGETVKLTITPNLGYELESGSLKFNDTAIEGNSFVMPSKNVTIKAKFKAISDDDTVFSISIANLTNGNILSDKTSALSGETVTLTITPNLGYELESGSLKYNDTAIEGNGFVMPSVNVTITAVFKEVGEIKAGLSVEWQNYLVKQMVSQMTGSFKSENEVTKNLARPMNYKNNNSSNETLKNLIKENISGWKDVTSLDKKDITNKIIKSTDQRIFEYAAINNVIIKHKKENTNKSLKAYSDIQNYIMDASYEEETNTVNMEQALDGIYGGYTSVKIKYEEENIQVENDGIFIISEDESHNKDESFIIEDESHYIYFYYDKNYYYDVDINYDTKNQTIKYIMITYVDIAKMEGYEFNMTNVNNDITTFVGLKDILDLQFDKKQLNEQNYFNLIEREAKLIDAVLYVEESKKEKVKINEITKPLEVFKKLK